jgi:hypothetical protein
MAVALPHELMGNQSNDNPYCGKLVSIESPNGSIHVAKVMDKCMGCVGYAIDATRRLFDNVVPAADGRAHGIAWWFEDA